MVEAAQRPGGPAGWVGLLAGLLLAGCDAATELPPPGASSGGEVTYWRGDETVGLRLQADRVRQLGETPGRLRLDGVRLVLPLTAGDLYVDAPQARHEATGGVQVVFAPPVHLHGVIDGKELVGRAEAAHITRVDRTLVLRDVELVGGLGHLRVATWTLRPGGSGEMSEVVKTALPPPWAAALPHLGAPPESVAVE